jgi:universal stress protein E
MQQFQHILFVSHGIVDVDHLKGNPEKIIPQFIEEKKIDILAMGTVARTGIPGFIIGNTAENILQKISCSLLALKPNGFVTPVKAY